MTIKQLRTLIAIADTRTFSAAAEVVHVTHAAVSQQMQNLEADLGVPLFNRETRTPELTPLAHRIVVKARELVADYDNLVPAAMADEGLSGELRLGTLRTMLTGLMPRAMALLKDRYPRVKLHIQPGLTSLMLTEIERGNLDAAVITRPRSLPESISFRPLATEPMHLIAAKNEPEDDPLVLLRQKPFIRFDRDAVLGQVINNWLLSKNIRVTEAMELGSPEAIASMVQADLGVSIVPDLVVKSSDAVPLKRISLGVDAPSRVLGLACLQTRAATKTIESVFDAFSHVIATAEK